MRRISVILLFLFVSFFLNGQDVLSIEQPGVVINHSPASKGLYIGSPSICILSDGNYVATHEFFGPGKKNMPSEVQVFLSTDKGDSWKNISKIEGQFMSKLFVVGDTLFILGPGASGLAIRKSFDGGFHWTSPVDEFTGKIFEGSFESAPTSVIFYNNRVWKAIEDTYGPKKEWGKIFRTFVISAPLNSDLLKASNWRKTNALPYNAEYLDGNFGGWLEGNIVLGPEEELYNILRVDYRQPDGEKAAIVSISEDGKTSYFNPSSGFIDFPGGCKKFNILYDQRTKKYWSLSNYVPASEKGYNPERTRNTVALMFSDDLRNWVVKGIVLHHPDVERHGFQYVDFLFEGKDIIFVSRTAYDDDEGGADNQHNANFITFHRVKDYKNYKTPDKWLELMPEIK